MDQLDLLSGFCSLRIWQVTVADCTVCNLTNDDLLPEQGVMGGVITGTAFTDQFPSINTTTGNGNAQLQGFVVAIYNIGCWAGSLLTMFIGENLGRKKTIMIGAAVLAVGTLIQCSSYTIAQLMVGTISRHVYSQTTETSQVGRIITGTGNGIITSTIPVWHAELCRAKSRGKFITVELSTNVVSRKHLP